MAQPKSGLRAERRSNAREARKLRRDLERRATLLPGGAPERAIEIATPSVVEVRAAATPCPLCGSELRLLDHVAETIEGIRLRVARLTCTSCGEKRSIYFRLEEPPGPQ